MSRTADSGASDLSDLISSAEAAMMLGVSRSTIERRVKDGTLPGAFVGKAWIVRRSDVEALRGHRCTQSDRAA